MRGISVSGMSLVVSLFYLRSTCTKSTTTVMHIAAKTVKKMMDSHRGVSLMNLVSSSIVRVYDFGREGSKKEQKEV